MARNMQHSSALAVDSLSEREREREGDGERDGYYITMHCHSPVEIFFYPYSI